MADDKSTNKTEDFGTGDQLQSNALAGVDTGVEGLSEGEVKALRDDAGLNQLAGHGGDLLAWEKSPAGKEFKDGEKDRVSANKAEAKAYEAQKDSEASKATDKYTEALGGDSKK